MLSQNDFFNKYSIEEYFKLSNLKWEELEQIYDDYVNRQDDINDCCQSLEGFCKRNLIQSKISFHSVRCRPKNPEHLIEKIIRKKGKEQVEKYENINASNYLEIVRDLIGLRILILSKEEWECIFDKLISIFPENKEQDKYMVEKPIAYTRYGDRNVFKDKIHMEHSNMGYRSQHYIVKYNEYYCEIQCRTLAEEVYGEFDHIARYPYRTDNKFLLRYTSVLSRLTDSVDEMISTCFQMKENGWKDCEQYFEEDKYLDWQHISQVNKNTPEHQSKNLSVCFGTNGSVNMAEYMNNTILRK